MKSRPRFAIGCMGEYHDYSITVCPRRKDDRSVADSRWLEMKDRALTGGCGWRSVEIVGELQGCIAKNC